MNRLIVSSVLVATAISATAAWSQATPPFQNNRYFATPLEKDPTREVGMQSVTMPPGAGNQFHRHPGDQWTAVQEGEVTFTVKGQPPQVLKAMLTTTSSTHQPLGAAAATEESVPRRKRIWTVWPI